MDELDLELERDKQRPVEVVKKGGWLGKIVALLLGIILGFVGCFGAIAAVVYYFIGVMKIEEGAGLMQLEYAAKGNFKITNDKFDFTGVSITIPKHALLEDGATYGVKVFLEGNKDVEIEGAFNTFTYANKEVTFSGNANVEIPVFTEGQYVIKVMFGKITNGNFMPVSGLIMMEAEYFGTYEITATIDGVEYVITYESIENQRFLANSEQKTN